MRENHVQLPRTVSQYGIYHANKSRMIDYNYVLLGPMHCTHVYIPMCVHSRVGRSNFLRQQCVDRTVPKTSSQARKGEQ